MGATFAIERSIELLFYWSSILFDSSQVMWLESPTSGFGQCKQCDYWSWAQYPASQENMQSTWGKTSFTSCVFLNRYFIIEAQIQVPKAARTKFSLIKNIHFHLFIGYMATITFQFKNFAIVKKCFTDWRFRLSVVMLSKCMHIYVCRPCPKLLHHLCSQSQFTKVIYSILFFFFKFKNMMNK